MFYQSLFFNPLHDYYNRVLVFKFHKKESYLTNLRRLKFLLSSYTMLFQIGFIKMFPQLRIAYSTYRMP